MNDETIEKLRKYAETLEHKRPDTQVEAACVTIRELQRELGEDKNAWYPLALRITRAFTALSWTESRDLVERARASINTVTLNEKERLFVIPCDEGYTCLGFDICERRSVALAAWIHGVHVSTKGIFKLPLEAPVGTLQAYDRYKQLLDIASNICRATDCRCPVLLTDSLVGLEGKLVEVTDCWGAIRRFRVGKSTGWCPIHLEIKKPGDCDGSAVVGTPFERVAS